LCLESALKAVGRQADDLRVMIEIFAGKPRADADIPKETVDYATRCEGQLFQFKMFFDFLMIRLTILAPDRQSP
jgi:hypothetical protein